MNQFSTVFELLENGVFKELVSEVKVYERSYRRYEGTYLVMVKHATERSLLVSGEGHLYNDLAGEVVGESQKVCPLTHENRLVLNRYFDYTKPQAFGKKISTIGLGDRLGLASPGHIEVIKDKNIKPVLSQQSVRELNLTNRSMLDVLDAASYAVFQEGYEGGFGADGDHLKEEADIEYMLSIGVSMVTLDCSDHIPNQIAGASLEELGNEYLAMPKETRDYFERKYLGRNFEVNGIIISFDKASLMKCVLVYHKAIKYTVHVYNTYIAKLDRPIDFEISIDETETITSPAEHFFVANELISQDVDVTSLAPRFCGEFQKGIDYIGDITLFEKELKEHALIADNFSYKLSIHSGSDKFKVFPIISKHTNGLFHIKTAGTNWLEAIRVIAEVNPCLYRKMHEFALAKFEVAQAYYHVTPELNNIRPLNEMKDGDLVQYMNNDEARQLFHITYGLLLLEKEDNGEFKFRDDFFETLDKNEETYRQFLKGHIGKHLQLLNF